MTKKLISIFVAVMMVLSIIPAAAFASEGARLPSPATEKSSTATEKAVASWDFEVDPTENGWQFADEDGDGHNWRWTTVGYHSVSHSIMSESVSLYGGGPCYPDNWAISPAFAVPEGGAEVTLFVRNLSADHPENYGVYVITSDTGANEIAVGQAASGSDWNEKVYDISDFAGETVSFAIRHYYVSDVRRWFFIDDITVAALPDPNVIYEADVSGFPVRIIENTTPADYADALVIPEGAEYELVRTDILNEQGTPLASDAELMVGETYLLVAELAAADGKTFDPNAELTVNEGTVEVDSMFTYPDGTSAYIAVRYVCAREAVVGFYFESDPAEEGWQYVDSDGDGYNWYWLAYGINQTTANMAYEGVGQLSSASYQATALTPDNWAISPEFEVPTSEGAIGMYICAQDPGYSDEHFAIYIGTGTEVDSYTMISEELVAEPSYAYYEFDLSEYAGETISIAIRHYNCTDQFRINLDCVEVLGSNEEDTPPEDSYLIHAVQVLDFVEPVWGESPDYTVTIPEDAHYSVANTAWYYITDRPTLMTPDMVFDNPEYSYRMSIVLVADEGYTFDISASGWFDIIIDSCSGYLFNSATQVTIYTGYFTVSEPAPEPIVIDTVEILGFVEPVWGANPFFGETVPEDAPYSIDYSEWYWQDDTNSDMLTETDTFNNPNCLYKRYFRLVPAEGYVFAEVLTITINGETTLVDADFTDNTPDLIAISTIGFTVEEPVSIIFGDTDGDGEVTTADALLALRYVMEMEELDEEQLAQADVDGDGEITMMDCLLIQRYAIGVIESFPVENP